MVKILNQFFIILLVLYMSMIGKLEVDYFSEVFRLQNTKSEPGWNPIAAAIILLAPAPWVPCGPSLGPRSNLMYARKNYIT